MKCEEAKEQLVMLAYGELSDEEQAELELHLHGCIECESEAAEVSSFRTFMAAEELPAVSPNLLAASRLKLDEALDEASASTASTWMMRFRSSIVGVWQHLYAAPALATLLVGVGFLGGTSLTRYQVANAPKPQTPVIFSNDSEGTIANVSGIVKTPDPNVVQVQYNRLVPTTFQGRIDEPQVQQLLMLAAQRSSDNDLRATSVNYLAQECKAGHSCEHGNGDAAGFRDALLVSLRYDKSPAVRMKALEGLQPYVGQDQKVRDAVLETLMRDGNADVRTHAINLLEPVEGDSSVRQVLHTVSTQDANPYIRNASMQALGSVDGIQ
jgi:HEAT repeats